jgi:GNAT superfamily N-acetyltransferase
VEHRGVTASQWIACSRARSGSTVRPLTQTVRFHLEIRAARLGEAEELSALALRAKAHWGYSPDVLESWKQLLQVTDADIAANRVFVGTIDGAVVGFYSLAPGAGPWELDNLWISPEFMHRGLGRELLGHALERARRGGASRVTVDADPNAESFYLRSGAVRCGEIPAPIPGNSERVRPQLAFDGRAI